MDIALISDIHANPRALEAVLNRIDQLGVEEIICLGDVIGYGADPKAALAMTRERCSLILRGNHEAGVLDPSYRGRFNTEAKAAIEWTAAQLDNEGFAFLETTRPHASRGDILLFHGSPSEPLDGYLLYPRCISRAELAEEFALVVQVGFGGHSHVPGVMEAQQADEHPFTSSEALGYSYRLQEGRKALVNVGSVGQPRNGDTRASFVTFDGETVTFHTVAYDHEQASADVRAVPELPNYLADRLLTGA